MNLSEIKLPSNRRFGFFFSLVFFLASSYFLFTESLFVGYIFFALAILFFLISIVKSSLLHPLNKLWMRFGILLGSIISPIVLGLIFFGLITPYGLIMRLFRRDELRLKVNRNVSHWKPRDQVAPVTDFNQQF